jgi:hypothetical protein
VVGLADLAALQYVAAQARRRRVVQNLHRSSTDCYFFLPDWRRGDDGRPSSGKCRCFGCHRDCLLDRFCFFFVRRNTYDVAMSDATPCTSLLCLSLDEKVSEMID